VGAPLLTDGSQAISPAATTVASAASEAAGPVDEWGSIVARAVAPEHEIAVVASARMPIVLSRWPAMTKSSLRPNHIADDANELRASG